MLVLSRKMQETVVLSTGGILDRVMKVTVLEIARSKVTLGFDVDAKIAVHRLEVWNRIAALGEPKTPELDPDPTVGLS